MTRGAKKRIIRENVQEMKAGCINTQVISAGKNTSRYEKIWKERGKRHAQESTIYTIDLLRK